MKILIITETTKQIIKNNKQDLFGISQIYLKTSVKCNKTTTLHINFCFTYIYM